MTNPTLDRAQALAQDLSRALVALRCRGHVVAVPGAGEPAFREARRFVEVALWMFWRVPHVMLVPCALPDGRPAVLAGTWDPRGVAIRQTVTSAAAFEAEVAAAARALAARHSPGELAAIEGLYDDGAQLPELENMEFWPEVLAKLRATAADPAEPDDLGAPVVAPIAERIWAARLDDLREAQRALED